MARSLQALIVGLMLAFAGAIVIMLMGSGSANAAPAPKPPAPTPGSVADFQAQINARMRPAPAVTHVVPVKKTVVDVQTPAKVQTPVGSVAVKPKVTVKVTTPAPKPKPTPVDPAKAAPVVCVGGNGDFGSNTTDNLAGAKACGQKVVGQKSVLDGGGTMVSTEPAIVQKTVDQTNAALKTHPHVTVQCFSYGCDASKKATAQLVQQGVNPSRIDLNSFGDPSGGVNAVGNRGVMPALVPNGFLGIVPAPAPANAGGVKVTSTCIQGDLMCDSPSSVLNVPAVIGGLNGYVQYHGAANKQCNYTKADCGYGSVTTTNGNITSRVILTQPAAKPAPAAAARPVSGSAR